MFKIFFLTASIILARPSHAMFQAEEEIPNQKEWSELSEFIFKHKIHQIKQPLSKSNFNLFYDVLQIMMLFENPPKESIFEFLAHHECMTIIAADGFDGLKRTYVTDTIYTPEQHSVFYPIHQLKIEEYLKAAQPYLKTLQKVHQITFSLLKKWKIIPLTDTQGKITFKRDNKDHLSYYFLDAQNNWVFIPTFVNNQKLLLLPFPWYQSFINSQNQIEYLQVTPLLRERELVTTPGFFVSVNKYGFASVLFTNGARRPLPFASDPRKFLLDTQFESPAMRVLNRYFGPGNLVPGFEEFIPLLEIETEEEEIVLQLVLLENEIETSEFPETAETPEINDEDLRIQLKAKQNEIETQILDRYVSEMEAKIQTEQAKRSQDVASGAIYSKEKKQPKTAPSPTPAAGSKSDKKQLDLRTIAKHKLETQKSRIKRHQFLSLIKSAKGILKTVSFKNQVIQSGSHLQIHGEGRQSVGVVIPHPGRDRTVRSGIVQKFLKEFNEFLKPSQSP